MAVISVKGGNSQVILDGSQDTLSLLAITTGTGLIHIGDPAPEGFDVPFAGGDKIVLPANLSATLRADGFVVTGSVGAYGGQTYSGGGGELLPTQAIIDDGQQITATNGQTILVAVADNVPSLTTLPYPMWQPFTVTCGSDGFGGFGYSAVEGEEMGAISNEPVDGYSVETCAMDGSGNFYFYLRGPKPMSDILWGADIGIDTVSYAFGPFNGQAAPSARLDGDIVSEAELSDVPAWTVDQQVPIVIIPQNGG